MGGEDHILNDTEERLGDPVDRDAYGEHEAEHDGHKGHDHLHCLAGVGCLLSGSDVSFTLVIADNGVVHPCADKHGQVVQSTGNQGEQGSAQLRPAVHGPELPTGDLSQIDPPKGKLKGFEILNDSGTVLFYVGGNGKLPVIAYLIQGQTLCGGISLLQTGDDICIQVADVG